MNAVHQGDIIYLNFTPQSDHAQMGRRPAIVVSNDRFNEFTKAAIVCPITGTDRGIPVHVRLDERTSTAGVILCDQVKQLDILSRNAAFVEKAPADILRQVLYIVTAFFE